MKLFLLYSMCLFGLSSAFGELKPKPAMLVNPEEYMGYPLIKDLLDEVARFVEPCSRMPKSDFSVEPRVDIQGSIEFSCAGGMRVLQFTFSNMNGVKLIESVDYGYGPKGNKPFTASEVSALRDSFFSKFKSAYGLTCEAKPHQSYRASDVYRCSAGLREPRIEFFELSVPTLSFLTKRLDLTQMHFRLNAYVRETK